MSNKNLLVMYHSPCMDGYGAVCAFADAVNKEDWDTIQYFPCGYGELEELPFMVGNNPLSGKTHVLCLDICPTPKTMDYMLVDRGLNVCILDHHNTAMDNLEYYNKAGVLFTITEDFSGASLVKALGPAINFVFGQEVTATDYLEEEGILTNNDTWKYLDRSRIESSKLYTLLEVRDLWLRDDPALKQQADDFCAYCKENDIAKGAVQPSSVMEGILEEALVEGRKINAAQEEVIMKAIDASITWQTVADEEELHVLVGDCPKEMSSMFGSLFNDSVMGNSLAIGTYSDGDIIAGLSLRSKGNIGYARIVAEALGGGGHDHSSGANFKGNKLTRDELIQRVKDILAA